jgi:methyltransferase
LVTLIAMLLWLGAQRILEVGLSRRHQQRLAAVGGIETGPSFALPLAGLHAAWFVCFLMEAWHRKSSLSFALIGMILSISGQTLRRWAIRTLGDRWVMTNLVVPGEVRVTCGPYRWLRHPNYVGVCLELVGFPLAWGCYTTALGGLAGYLCILCKRLKYEEQALVKYTR